MKMIDKYFIQTSGRTLKPNKKNEIRMLEECRNGRRFLSTWSPLETNKRAKKATRGELSEEGLKSIN